MAQSLTSCRLPQNPHVEQKPSCGIQVNPLIIKSTWDVCNFITGSYWAHARGEETTGGWCIPGLRQGSPLALPHVDCQALQRWVSAGLWAQLLCPRELEAKPREHWAGALPPGDMGTLQGSWRQAEMEWPLQTQLAFPRCQAFSPLHNENTALLIHIHQPQIFTSAANCTDKLFWKLLKEITMFYVAHSGTLIGNVLHRHSITVWELNIMVLIYFLPLVSVRYVTQTIFPSYALLEAESEQGNNTWFQMPVFVLLSKLQCIKV